MDEMRLTLVLSAVACLIIPWKKVACQRNDWKCTQKGERCPLPFTVNFKQYDSCTTDYVPGRPWCLFGVRADGKPDLRTCAKCEGDHRCYLTAESFSDGTWTLTCPPGCANVQEKLWGNSNEYSADSFVCAAAIFEGKITNDTGGVVAFYKQRWRKVFYGGVQHGVTSQKDAKRDHPAMKFNESAQSDPVPQIIVSNERSILSLSPGSSRPRILIDELNDVVALTVDIRRKKIYWNDAHFSVFSANFDGTDVTNTKAIFGASENVHAEAIAIDWVHGYLFWSDSSSHSVSMFKDEGKLISTLIKRDSSFSPKALAVDPKNGYIYIGDSGIDPKIEKCLMSEKDACETVVETDVKSPVGITLDIENNLMCWTDVKPHPISCTDLNGLNRKNITNSASRAQYPFAVTLFGNRVYWTDWDKLVSVKSESWDDLHFHLGDLEKPLGLVIYDEDAQIMYPNQCVGAPCSQLCLPSPTGYKCLCADGYQVSGNNPSKCEAAVPKQRQQLHIYIADAYSIKLMKIMDNKATAVTPVTGLRLATAIALDTRKSMLYWTDSSKGSIEMGPLSDNIPVSQRRTFLDKLSGFVMNIQGMAIDATSRLLYWTDSSLHAVFVAKLELVAGQHHVTIVVNGSSSYEPKSIALDAKKGYMYISDVKTPVTIQKCEMRGDPTCHAIVQQNIVTPSGLALDIEESRLYFTDERLKKIESCDLDGGNRRILLSRNRFVQKPFAIGIFDGRVYWNDLITRQLLSVDKETGTKFALITQGLRLPKGMLLVDPQAAKPDGSVDRCADSQCRYLCVPTPRQADGKEFACLCPEKFKQISGEPECVQRVVEDVVCKSGYVQTADRRSCVDEDECTRMNTGCQHECINTIGSFKCGCEDGYVLEADEKSCKEAENLCDGDPCENDGICHLTIDGTEFHCECKNGFNGQKCEDILVKLEKEENVNPNSTIRLQCVAPPALKSVILWRKDRKDIDLSVRGFDFENNRRTLVIYRPNYLSSGNYTCQISFNGREYIGRATVVIPVHPQYACGQSPGMEEPSRSRIEKILGGSFTAPKMAPFVAMLYKTTYRGRVSQGVFCGGSLIDTKHVVSAAHCFREVEDHEIIVYLGKIDTKVSVIEPYQQSSAVDTILRHPDYNDQTLHGDIAIINLKNSVYFSEAVKPICIALPDDKTDDIKARASKTKESKYGLVFGWGLTEEGQRSRYLLEVKVPVLKQKVCNEIYPGEITDTMFCAGGKKNQDSCDGDSGGPLALWSTKKRIWYLGGIVSWGEACGEAGKPGIYTRIGKGYRQWIYDNTDI